MLQWCHYCILNILADRDWSDGDVLGVLRGCLRVAKRLVSSRVAVRSAVSPPGGDRKVLGPFTSNIVSTHNVIMISSHRKHYYGPRLKRRQCSRGLWGLLAARGRRVARAASPASGDVCPFGKRSAVRRKHSVAAQLACDCVVQPAKASSGENPVL